MTTTIEHPADCHPDLTDDRLQSLANLFAETRAEVVSLHDPSAGDDSWCLGCRGFARTRNLILSKAATADWPWLRILNPGKQFIFAIGEVPVRFYRGQHDRAPSRTLSTNAIELRQLSLAFDEAARDLSGLKWRFAIETDFLGNPCAVIFAALHGDDGAVAYSWTVPFDLVADALAESPFHSRDMVELDAPSVFAPKEVRAKDA
jgi:hypothetical protein